MDIQFSINAWAEYVEWQQKDKKTIKRINELLKDIVRKNPFDGIWKPESLKDNLSGFWSRRIDDQNRLVYRIDEEHDICQVVQCRGHYDKG